jgi:hypothetical protein
MYLRSTKRKNKDGSTVEYFQLAHNERHPQTRKPVAKIIHNFGRADQLDRQELVRLCNSIARVCGLIVTDPVDPVTQSIGFGEGLKIKQTLALGCPLVVEALWERLGRQIPAGLPHCQRGRYQARCTHQARSLHRF